MDVVVICDSKGWTYQQYIDFFYDQPSWFVDLTVAKWKADADNEERKRKKSTAP